MLFSLFLTSLLLGSSHLSLQESTLVSLMKRFLFSRDELYVQLRASRGLGELLGSQSPCTGRREDAARIPVTLHPPAPVRSPAKEGGGEALGPWVVLLVGNHHGCLLFLQRPRPAPGPSWAPWRPSVSITVPLAFVCFPGRRNLDER